MYREFRAISNGDDQNLWFDEEDYVEGDEVEEDYDDEEDYVNKVAVCSCSE